MESIYKNSDQVLVVSLSIAEAALLIFCAIVDQIKGKTLNNGALNQDVCVCVKFNFV